MNKTSNQNDIKYELLIDVLKNLGDLFATRTVTSTDPELLSSIKPMGSLNAFKSCSVDSERNLRAQRELSRTLPGLLRTLWTPLSESLPPEYYIKVRNEYGRIAATLGDLSFENKIMHAPFPSAGNPSPKQTDGAQAQTAESLELDLAGPELDAPLRCESLSESQKRVFELLIDRASLFFDLEFRNTPELRNIRLTTMLVGPTGCGKTSIVEKVAYDMCAVYGRYTVGSWVVNGAGAENGTATIAQIVQLMLRNKRVIVHIDEFDKLSFDPASRSEWSRSIANDIFDLLDGRLNAHHLTSQRRVQSGAGKDSINPDRLRQYFRERVFFVCSGTWQNEHSGERTGQDVAQAIRERVDFPAELSRRVHDEWLILDYPEIEEVGMLLERLGISALARKQNHVINLPEVYGSVLQRGMSAIEDIRDRLGLSAHASFRKLQHELMSKYN